MQTMKKALTSAGLESTATEETPKVQVRYKVLHVPTASYIYAYDSKVNQFKLAIFANKAKAGHGRDDYRLQRFKTRTYSGQGLFLEEDIREYNSTAAKSRYGHSVWQIQSHIREKIKKHGHFHNEEFELIPLEEGDAGGLEVAN